MEPSPGNDEEAGHVLRRIRRNSIAAYFVFAVITLISKGFSGLLGLTCSAALTMISFLWLEDTIDAVLQPSNQPRPWMVIVRTAVRFPLMGAALLVTIFVARFNALSVLLGFSIVVVGIIGEALHSTYRSFAG